jgi:hypothetical protein
MAIARPEAVVTNATEMPAATPAQDGGMKDAQGRRITYLRLSVTDRCNFRFKLKQLRKEIIKTKNYNLLVCPACWDPDHPQLQLGMYPVDDPQGIRDPRPDISYVQSGNTGLQVTDTTATTQNAVGLPSEGSRDFQLPVPDDAEFAQGRSAPRDRRPGECQDLRGVRKNSGGEALSGI